MARYPVLLVLAHRLRSMDNARFSPRIGHTDRMILARRFENADESEGRRPRFAIETHESVPPIARSATNLDGCNSYRHT